MKSIREPLPPPAGLAERGLEAWNRLTVEYDFRTDEVHVVREFCRTLDTLERLATELESAPTMVMSPSQGLVPNRLFAEVRQQRLALRGLASSLALPDAAGGRGGDGMTVSENARKASRARWSRGA
ncbi:hypothetical protein [Streptosporangium minutum]|uniref:Uncharacterized protein n=1 Tax=Streptosporangium minutum TaxID=569862 RepID=A0A243RMI6_9ACTN|nr:hypothetical protein [Streptosporangium minutum]OUC96067.1 hypothetical protein CA984_16440 [Streptosporangium minutum]